eukprot:3923736-Alexandrium_andersonii.AAC.1
MSASLVGSEMCIRDRLWVAPWSLGERPGAPWSLVELWGALQSLGELREACLLYTSDAADDM